MTFMGFSSYTPDPNILFGGTPSSPSHTIGLKMSQGLGSVLRAVPQLCRQLCARCARGSLRPASRTLGEWKFVIKRVGLIHGQKSLLNWQPKIKIGSSQSQEIGNFGKLFLSKVMDLFPNVFRRRECPHRLGLAVRGGRGEASGGAVVLFGFFERSIQKLSKHFAEKTHK